MTVGMEVVDGMHSRECRGVDSISGDAGVLPECEVIHR